MANNPPKPPAFDLKLLGQAKQLKQINLRYLWRTRQPLVLAGLIVVVSVLIVPFGIWPQVQQTLDLNTQIAAEREQLMQLQEKIAALEQSDTLSLVDQAAEINQLLPSQKPLLEMMTSLNQSAGEAGVEVTNIEVRPGTISTVSAAVSPQTTRRSSSSRRGAAPTRRAYDQLDLKVVISGSLLDISAFIETIELMAPLTNVTSISLSEASGREAEIRPFQAELTITTYYFSQPIAATIEAPLPEISPTAQSFIDQLSDFTFPTQNRATVIRGGGQEDLFGVDDLSPLETDTR